MSAVEASENSKGDSRDSSSVDEEAKVEEEERKEEEEIHGKCGKDKKCEGKESEVEGRSIREEGRNNRRGKWTKNKFPSFFTN